MASSLPSGWWIGCRLALSSPLRRTHRTGVLSDAPLSRALKLVDALAILVAYGEPAAVAVAMTADDPGPALLARDPSRPWLVTIILDNAAALGVASADLAAMLET